ncbi:hypothetical protein TWF730_000160 [Orbilia blumenaviensis]|uniref:AA9 family lytic polysaccharide monooxygenase n=1 Tax=Orbilia blumenaviensis TaxID=1796055 RepID=A0AAV9VKQ0_9PEZI
MKIKTFLLTGMLASASMAHHVITHFLVDNVPQPNVIRQPGTLNPIVDPNDRQLACGHPPGNGQGMKGTSKAVVQPGSSITFEWHTNWSSSVSGPEGVTDVSHKGPCAIYMRKVPDSVTAIAEDPRKPNWFKIWEDGVDRSGIFCTSRMRLNGGLFTGVIPKHLENGDYLIRAETLTLNNAGKPNLQPQWYVGCAQVTLKDSEAPFIKPVTIPIPSGEYANMNMPGLRYNIWYPERSNYSDYGPVPGPAVFNDGSDKYQEPGATLPDGFATIPWPSRTTALPEKSKTHTHVLTRTATFQVIRTVYVTRTPPKTTSTPITMHDRIPHPHTTVITRTRYVTVTRTRHHPRDKTRKPPTGTPFTGTPEPIDIPTPTPYSESGTIHSGRGYHYRSWRRHYARMRRF